MKTRWIVPMAVLLALAVPAWAQTDDFVKASEECGRGLAVTVTFDSDGTAVISGITFGSDGQAVNNRALRDAARWDRCMAAKGVSGHVRLAQ